MASIHQDPRTKIWSVRYDLPNGKRLSKSLKTKIKDVAEDRFKLWLKDEHPKLMATGRLLSDLLHLWLRQTTAGEDHKDKVKAHWKEFQGYFENIPISNITREMINEYYIYWKTKRTVKGGGIATMTYRNNYFRSLRLVWLWSIDSKYIVENIFKDVKKLKTSARMKSLSPTQLLELLNVAQINPLHQKFIQFMIFTACRPKELWKIKHTDIDHKRIYFYDSKTGDTSFPKSKAIENLLSEIKGLQKPDTEYVFSDIDGKHLCYDTVGSICRNYLIKAGFKDYRPYDIRHTVITNWANEMTAFKVKRLARHKLISTTLAYVDESALDIDEDEMNVLTYIIPKDKITGKRPKILSMED